MPLKLHQSWRAACQGAMFVPEITSNMARSPAHLAAPVLHPQEISLTRYFHHLNPPSAGNIAKTIFPSSHHPIRRKYRKLDISIIPIFHPQEISQSRYFHLLNPSIRRKYRNSDISLISSSQKRKTTPSLVQASEGMVHNFISYLHILFAFFT